MLILRSLSNDNSLDSSTATPNKPLADAIYPLKDYRQQGRTMGFEPTNGGTTNHCLNLLATPAIRPRFN